MNPRFFPAAVFLAAAPLYGQAEHPAAVQVEIVLSEGERTVAKTVLHTDLFHGNATFRGTATLKIPDGREWVISVDGNPGLAEDNRLLSVDVTDARRLRETLRDGSSSVWPLEIFECNRAWKGPGAYRIAEVGGQILTIRVADTPELRAVKAPGLQEKK